MNLSEQFRAVLDQEAEMLTPTRPDIEALIRGGRARRRHRNTARIGIAAAAVLVTGGVYGGTQIDRGDTGSQPGITNQPTQSSDSTTIPPPYRDRDASLPAPGTYRKIVGVDASSGARIEADLTFEDPRWYSGGQPVISAGDESSPAAGLGVFEAQALPGRSGCSGEATGNATFTEAARTPDAVGRQLAKLPSSAVIQALTPTVAFGYDAFHLRLRIDAECPPGEAYIVAQAETGSLGITYNAPWTVVIDFLVVDVDGTPIVVALWHDAHASSTLVDEATHVRDSISFVPGEPTS
jgi:hypothetical protein